MTTDLENPMCDSVQLGPWFPDPDIHERWALLTFQAGVSDNVGTVLLGVCTALLCQYVVMRHFFSFSDL